MTVNIKITVCDVM